MSDLKLCINCRHQSYEGPMMHWCNRPKAIDDNINLVTGEMMVPPRWLCSDERYGNAGISHLLGRCGREAKYFEPALSGDITE